MGGEVLEKPPQTIQLSNPVESFYETFIFANSLKCEKVVELDSCKGQTVVICGAGPSLADEADEWCGKADQLWGANSALTWLIEHGHKPTHGITVDQTPAMVNEWKTTPDVEYLVASTIHPHLTDLLIERGRSITFFHNYVGIKKPPVQWCVCGHDHETGAGCLKCECQEYDPRFLSYEDWLYVTLFPGTVRVGSGLNTVTRSIDVALAMGFDKVIVLGADCAIRVKRPLPSNVMAGSEAHLAWLKHETVMHADGGNALASGATPVTIGGMIDGRWWETKPDMAISAMFMHRMREVHGDDRLIFIGDTLPNAIRDKPSEFLAKMPALTDSEGNPMMPAILPPGLT